MLKTQKSENPCCLTACVTGGWENQPAKWNKLLVQDSFFWRGPPAVRCPLCWRALPRIKRISISESVYRINIKWIAQNLEPRAIFSRNQSENCVPNLDNHPTYTEFHTWVVM